MKKGGEDETLYNFLVSILFVLNLFAPLKAEQYRLRGPVCREEIYYEESNKSTVENVVFNHHVRKSDINSQTSFEIEVMQSLSLTHGFSLDVDTILANASVDFHMSYVGTRKVKVKVTWPEVKAGQAYRLVYGNYMTTVNGYIVNQKADCSENKRFVSLTGTQGSFQYAVEE